MSNEPIQVPAWLTNGDMPSPCLCGRPLIPGEAYLVAEDEEGMKRWFHMLCWRMMQDFSEDEDGL